MTYGNIWRPARIASLTRTRWTEDSTEWSQIMIQRKVNDTHKILNTYMIIIQGRVYLLGNIGQCQDLSGFVTLVSIFTQMQYYLIRVHAISQWMIRNAKILFLSQMQNYLIRVCAISQWMIRLFCQEPIIGDRYTVKSNIPGSMAYI